MIGTALAVATKFEPGIGKGLSDVSGSIGSADAPTTRRPLGGRHHRDDEKAECVQVTTLASLKGRLFSEHKGSTIE